MSEIREKLDEELEAVRRTRDELKLKMHLAKADARDRWEELERKLREVERMLKQRAQSAQAPTHELAEAARKLLGVVRDGYHDLRRMV